MKTIQLTPSEAALAQHLAVERIRVTGPTRTNDQMGHLDDQPGAREKADVAGVAGELAFCKAYNLWPDLDSSGPCTADACLRDGRTVDVKTTPVKGGNLIANHKPHKTDLMVLVEADANDFHIIGFIPTEQVVQDRNLEPMHGRLVYKVAREELIDL